VGVVVPRMSYLICATPRGGSTLLSDALGGTGIAGLPEEHFEVWTTPSFGIFSANTMAGTPSVWRAGIPPGAHPASGGCWRREVAKTARKG
jgi:LPS sulfotransferase NodH